LDVHTKFYQVNVIFDHIGRIQTLLYLKHEFNFIDFLEKRLNVHKLLK